MRASIAIALLAALSGLTVAGDNPTSFAEAKKIWDSTKDRKEYQQYIAEFSQFNNYMHLDEKDGCYALAKGPVELMLVITHQGQDEYAVISQVLTNVDNAKAQCFKGSYGGVQTKIPPFFPFVLQMSMGG
jgi:hypothetical protein